MEPVNMLGEKRLSPDMVFALEMSCPHGFDDARRTKP